MRWKTKNRYQINILKYKDRREKLREKYPNRFTSLTEKEAYNKAVKRINIKICQWGLMIRVIERREKEIEQLAQQVCDFLSIPYTKRFLPLKNSIRNKEATLARLIFYKYGLEKGISGIYLAQWVGSWKKTPANGRLKFTRSFQHNLENKKTWDHFKLYLKTNITGGIEYLEAA